MMKPILPLAAALSMIALSSCEKKSEAQKQVEASTEQAVKSGEMTKEQAKEVNKAADKIEDAAQDTKKSATDLLDKLEKAKTTEEIKDVIREVTKKNLETMVKAGQMTKEQADQMLVTSETSMNALTEEQLKAQIQQLKQMVDQMK
jgi:polyhydroxyalkanoate synthesis regulator phasin